MNEFFQPNFSVSKTEMFDINMAKYIVSQPIDAEDKKKIKKMIKLKERGYFLDVNYILGKKSKQNKYGKEYLGRIVPKGNYGLQTLSSDIRNALAIKYYWDVDIENCQAELLNQISTKNGWINTHLTKYCSDRDSIFKEIMLRNNFDRKQVKIIFLSLLFGGSCNYVDPWIKNDFYPEIQSIMNNLANLQPELVNDCKKDKPNNFIGSACAIILQTHERKILLKLDEFFTLNGRQMDTLIHDGGYIQKLKNETHFPDDLLKKAEDFIFKETQFKIKLVVKPISTTFQLPKDVDEDKTYVAVKSEFEKRIFLCCSEASFYDTFNRKVNKFSKTDLMTVYQSKKYTEFTDGTLKECSFITKWLDDDTKRKYEYVDTLIPPLECPDNTFNLWTGFEVEYTENNDNDDFTNDLEFILNHIRLLCGKDELLFNYTIKWLACIFQQPAFKNNISILFKSIKQGMGKNLFFDLIRNMIGHKYCCVIDKPERDVFGTFNSLMENKLLVLFDEMAGKVGFKYDEEIKALITSNTIDITSKGKATKTVNNYTKIIMNTNNDYPVKIPVDDRRFVICDSSFMDIPPKDYFENLVRIINDKNILRAFFDYLMEIDLSTIDWIRDRPETEAFNDIKMASLDIELRFLLDFIDEKDGIDEYKAKDLFIEFQSFIHRECVDYKTNQIKFCIKLKNYRIDGYELLKKRDCNYYSFDFKKIKSWCIRKNYLI